MSPQRDRAPRRATYVRLIRRRAWIVVVCAVVLPIAAYAYTGTLPEVFQSSTIIQVGSTADGATASDLGAPPPNARAVASFVGTSPVADEAARRLGEAPGSLLGVAVADADDDTGFVRITATGPTAQRSAEVADAFAAALNATREARGRERVEVALTALRTELKKTPARAVDRRDELTLQIQRLDALRTAQGQNTQVLQPALPGALIAPHPRRNAMVALLLGLLVGSGLAAFVERTDRRLRTPDELEKDFDLPFLGSIPDEAFGESTGSELVEEAFETLRNSLTYLNPDAPLKSVVVLSALEGEGKTTVATNLARAYASTGKRVVLVDTDLRKPEVAQRVGIKVRHGLADVVAGTVPLDAALVPVPLFGDRLRVLPGVAIQTKPSALLGSERMAEILRTLEGDSDLVIIDTPPLLVVSDAFPLLDRVSGIVALARLDQTSVDAVERMIQIVGSAGGRLVGVAATGARRDLGADYGYGHGHGYGYGYGSNGDHAPADARPVSGRA